MEDQIITMLENILRDENDTSFLSISEENNASFLGEQQSSRVNKKPNTLKQQKSNLLDNMKLNDHPKHQNFQKGMPNQKHNFKRHNTFVPQAMLIESKFNQFNFPQMNNNSINQFSCNSGYSHNEPAFFNFDSTNYTNMMSMNSNMTNSNNFSSNSMPTKLFHVDPFMNFSNQNNTKSSFHRNVNQEGGLNHKINNFLPMPIFDPYQRSNSNVAGATFGPRDESGFMGSPEMRPKRITMDFLVNFTNSPDKLSYSPTKNTNDFSELSKLLSILNKIDAFLFSKLKGNFIWIIKSQNGSRIFQKYLKNTSYDIIHKILCEIVDQLNFLMIDNYANYFCHKFYGYLNKEDRMTFLNTVSVFLFI
jgi:hypothetical protein